MHVEKLKSPLYFFKDSVVDIAAIDFWLQHVNPLWSVNQALGIVVNKKHVANEMVSLKIKVNRHFVHGHPGQHHPVALEINGRRYERTYSLTQIDKHHVQLTVKQVAQGKVSSWLVNTAKAGDVLEFGLPYGEMQTPEHSDPLVLLAAGSGITPMYSLLMHWEKHKHLIAKSITLLYWVKHPEDAAFQAEFEELALKFPKFQVKVFYTQTEQADARINESDVENLTNLANSTVYACGPSGFVTKATQLFAAAKNIQSEAFSLSSTQSQASGFVNLTLAKSQQVLRIPRGQSILQSLEQQNIKPIHGCRMGICNKCVCHKVEGATRNLVNGLENSEPNHQLKICVNSADSDLVIDL